MKQQPVADAVCIVEITTTRGGSFLRALNASQEGELGR